MGYSLLVFQIVADILRTDSLWGESFCLLIFHTFQGNIKRKMLTNSFYMILEIFYAFETLQNQSWSQVSCTNKNIRANVIANKPVVFPLTHLLYTEQKYIWKFAFPKETTSTTSRRFLNNVLSLDTRKIITKQSLTVFLAT